MSQLKCWHPRSTKRSSLVPVLPPWHGDILYDVFGNTVVASLKSNRYHAPVSFPSFGRAKNAPSQTVEPPEDAELTGYLAALAPEGDVETTGSGRRFGNAQVYQLRLSLMANAQLQELARRHQTSPLALAQEWITQRLAWESRQQGPR